MTEREVQQSLQKVIARKEPCNARKGSSAYSKQPPTKSRPQICSALIGLLCRPAVPTQSTTSPPSSTVEATSTSAKSHGKLTAAGHDTRASGKHRGSADEQHTSATSANTAAPCQECPLCQQQIPSHDLQRHINAELDGIMSASTSSQPAARASFNAHASARSTHLQNAAVAEEHTEEAKPTGSGSSTLPQSSVEQQSCVTGRGLHPRMHGHGSRSGRKGPERLQHGSQQARRIADRAVSFNPRTGGSIHHTCTNLLGRQPTAATHGGKLCHAHGDMAASAEARRRQCSWEDLERTVAKSGAAQSGAPCGPQGRKRLEHPSKPPLPSAKVLILGAGKVDQQRNPELKRVNARASRGQPSRAASGSFDHYHTGHGFWDSSMLGLDGADNLGTHMWEGLGTATWSGLGPP